MNLSSEKLCNHRQNFIISFISPVLSSVSYELQILFLAFGVVRIGFFRDDVQNSPTEVCNMVQIILVQSFCPLVTQMSGVFLLNVHLIYL